ncbi:MAG TPA: Type 1 glutamine amidotransferase-like domain-containing protein [Mycobacteriales bacterium]|nr:Type 1 glutamine amidotransferase-like domain-containing protein [Mycobacteriales bacterium]
MRTVFIPTAGLPYSSTPWITEDRRWFSGNGLATEDLELATATARDVENALARADLVYVAGGNTYFLLHHMKRTQFWDAAKNRDLMYSGASAGAIVACPDIAYIGNLDDRGAAPDLADTVGAGLLDFRIMPHMNDERARPTIDRILSQWAADTPLIKLTDDEAVVFEGSAWRVVESPPVLTKP